MRNADLFNRIADVIEEHPEQYDQGVWIGDETQYANVERYGTVAEAILNHECGTAACVAGWACVLSWGPKIADHLVGWQRDGARLLGITADEADVLFSETWEPPAGETVSEALRRYANGDPILYDEDRSSCLHRFVNEHSYTFCYGCGIPRQEALEDLARTIQHEDLIPPWTDNHELYTVRRRQEAEAREQ